jgi:hypothetical protein
MAWEAILRRRWRLRAAGRCAVLVAAAALGPAASPAATGWGTGVGKKVRFYLTVSKAELLRAPFSTQGGDRLAQTRLRVTLRTATGSALFVRDGQIKVSIARIKSGALPGLKGIL